MRKFLLMLLAVLFCTSALCTVDTFANDDTSDNDLKQITITNQNNNQSNNQNSDQNRNQNQTINNTKENAYSEEEVYLTAQLVYHEAHNQDYDGKVAIAEVVLNRVNSKLFPDSIEEVLYQKGQFAGKNGIKKCVPTNEEIKLTNDVLNGGLRVLNDSSVLYFRNPKITSGISAKTEKNWGKLKYYTYIGEHAFYSQTIITTDDLETIPTEARVQMASNKAKKGNGNGKATANNEAATVTDAELSAEVVATLCVTDVDVNMNETMNTNPALVTEMQDASVNPTMAALAQEASINPTMAVTAQEVNANSVIAATGQDVNVNPAMSVAPQDVNSNQSVPTVPQIENIDPDKAVTVQAMNVSGTVPVS